MQKLKHIIIFILLSALPPGAWAGGDIYTMAISDAIGPGIADFLAQAVQKAEDNDAACLIVELDTPGGLVESMRGMVQVILGSKMPVVVYVSPGGARAASAGVFITLAADVAAMSPGTHIGAAHPVSIGESDDTVSEKIVNDLAAFARSIAGRRGRNADWAEKSVRESISITETEALKENVIDLTAENLDDLIRRINGRKVEGKGILNLDKARQVRIEENIRTKILKTISDPNIAYILMMIGLAGLYFELAHPGVIFPGVIGGICLILSFFALQTLPVNYAGILLILLALVFFFLEMKVTSFGMLTLAGMTALVLGSVMLFEGQSPAMRISLKVLIGTCAFISAFFALLAGLVFKAQVLKSRTGADGLVGEIGIVKKDIMPNGKVFVHGELWQARSAHPLAEGSEVRVIRVSGLTLEVSPVSSITRSEGKEK
jgi:membrane-bound serine protease (ClpP class)